MMGDLAADWNLKFPVISVIGHDPPILTVVLV